ncbi:MAG: response regulator [Desulfobacterales bacterium]|nr:response regulator [Desulfobacterales bacterium]
MATSQTGAKVTNGEKHFKILFVDDEKVAHRSIGGFLRDLGYRVLIAENGKQALDMLQKENGVGLIISDIRMPVMNGLQLLRSLREQKRRLPVILITGYGDIDSAAEALRYDAFEYLKKPVNLNQLLASIKHIEEFNSE